MDPARLARLCRAVVVLPNLGRCGADSRRHKSLLVQRIGRATEYSLVGSPWVSSSDSHLRFSRRSHPKAGDVIHPPIAELLLVERSAGTMSHIDDFLGLTPVYEVAWCIVHPVSCP
jgi:hypothetical protein